MRDSYVGDVGDFGKYAFLKALAMSAKSRAKIAQRARWAKVRKSKT